MGVALQSSHPPPGPPSPPNPPAPPPHPPTGLAGKSEGGELSALVVRARGGDRLAFERIVHATARVVYAQVVASVRDRQKAEDLTQETFVAAWRAIGTVESPGGFVGWLL